MARPKIHDEALRGRLLERAGEMLSAGGLAAISLRTLARDCGTSTTAVYSLFGGKPALLAAALDEALRRFTARLATVAPSGDPVEDIVQQGAAYRYGALADPHLFDAMFTGELQPAGAKAVLEPLYELVDRAVAAKALRAELAPATAAVTLWATVHGWVLLERRGMLPEDGLDDRAARFEDALRTVLDGWRTPEPV